jgi:ribonucleoside-diphosphate reductase alpha chain
MLKGIRCPSIAWEDGKSVLSCADAIATVLDNCIRGQSQTASSGSSHDEKTTAEIDSGPIRNIAGQCPDCGGLLRNQEGCFICPNCGYTKCQ